MRWAILHDKQPQINFVLFCTHDTFHNFINIYDIIINDINDIKTALPDGLLVYILFVLCMKMT